MVQRFPAPTDETVEMTTKSASQRRVVQDQDTGLTRITPVQIPVEFGRFLVHEFGMTDLKKHFGPAVVYERPDFDANAQRRPDAPAYRYSGRSAYPMTSDFD